MKRYRQTSIFFVLLFLVGAAVVLRQRSSSETESGWHPVQVEHEARVIREVGTLEAKELARIQAAIKGVITRIAGDGSPVEPGQVILQVDQEEMQIRLETDLEDLEQSREDYQNQLAEYAVLTNSFNLKTRLKVAERDHAALELELGSIPLTAEEEALMEIDLRLAELDLEEKQAELIRQEELVKQNFAPASSLDRLRLDTASARTFLEEKRSQFTLAKLPVNEEDRLTLKAALDKAEKDVQRNEARQALQLKIQELTLEGMQLDIRHKEEQVARLREDLEQVELTAPVKGLIRLFRTYEWSARAWQPLSVGKGINSRDMVATVVDPAQLSLRLMLHESDFPEVRVGQPVRATLTAFPEKEVRGRVASVAEVGQDRDDLSPLYRQSPPVGQALFLAHVDLEIDDERVLPGMTTHVEIEVEPPSDRLIIPASALMSAAPPYRVLRRRDGEIEEVPVEGGFDRLGRFEVSRGLQEGDEVKEQRGDGL